jgi:aspartate-semialdehyde dehydrogenase
VTPSCVNNLEYEHLTPRSIEATDYNRIGRLRQGKNKQIMDLWALSDILRVGAALNAVRTAEYIINQGYLKI